MSTEVWLLGGLPPAFTPDYVRDGCLATLESCSQAIVSPTCYGKSPDIVNISLPESGVAIPLALGHPGGHAVCDIGLSGIPSKIMEVVIKAAIEAVDGELADNFCPFASANCHPDNCIFGQEVAAQAHRLIEYLDRRSIADIKDTWAKAQ